MKSLGFYMALILTSLFALSTRAENADSLKVIEHNRVSFELVYSEPDKAKAEALKALNLSKEIENHFLEASSFNQLGIVYDVTSKFDSAIYCYLSAIEICKENNYEVLRARAYNNLGLIYWNMGEHDTAIACYTYSVKIFEEKDIKKGLANALSNIGALHADKRDNANAIRFHKRALAIRQEMEDNYGMSVSYANLGSLYLELQILDSARMFVERSIALKDTAKDKYGLGINYNNLGSIMRMEEKTDSAIWAVSKAKDLMREIGQKYLMSANYGILGDLYADKSDFDEAYRMLDSAEHYALEVDSRRGLLNIYGRYSRVDTLAGNYRLAAKHLTKRIRYQSEIYDIEREKVIEDIQTRYETEKKERELAESQIILAEEQLKVRRRTIWAIALLATLALLIVIGLGIYRQQKQKEKRIKQESHLREELARAEVKVKIQEERVRISRDLHDHIGSQLTIISSGVDQLAFDEKDKKRKEALHEIGDNGRDTMLQLRETIWAMNQEVIDLNTLAAKTREFISHLPPVEGKVEVQLNADEGLRLSPALAINVYRIVQEAVNNAVKYSGFKNMTISFEKENGTLTAEVVDDGRGFVLNDNTEKGYGLVNMQERVKKFHGTLDLSSEPGKGTRVKVRVPLNAANYV